MMVINPERKRPEHTKKLWWCRSCDGQWMPENKGQWIRGLSTYDRSSTTGETCFHGGLPIPAGVCICCGSDDIHGPLSKE